MAVATLTGALGYPLHALVERWLWAHMVQHELLILVAAPLLVYGRALPVAASVLPRRVGHAILATTRALVPGPFLATVLHGVALWLWHVPSLHDAALRSVLVHLVEHAALFGTAVVFWQAIVDAPRRRYGLGVLCVFLTTLHTTALGAVLTLSAAPWFSAYVRPAGVGVLSALEDQQLAGLVMWVPGGIVLTLVGLVLAVGLLRDSERLALRSLLIVACVAASASACNAEREVAHQMTGGDPARGPAAIRKYGCQTCHTIPGVPGATGTVGPPLAGMARRAYIAGRLENSPGHLLEWIQHPQHVGRPTAMPEMGVTERDGRDIAAYLYTLR